MLTGSARLFVLQQIPDPLPGRAETIELWPLSQGEIGRTREVFVETVFDDGPGFQAPASALHRPDYLQRALTGGYPEAVRRADLGRRARFFESTASDLISRDVRQLSDIERPADMRRLLGAVAPARQLIWTDEPIRLYRYRDRDGYEVDAVLEHASGEVVAIEVKAAETVRSDDFRGIRHLAQRVGDQFVAGIVLHAGTQVLPFGDRLRALPISTLWTA